ncbi:hypothetical protein [Chitinophaga flava]|uniref:Uncharacterized protein n=1 Tax=Chitinophaga flava TaxID=2259036 RepID=A0A365Y444_9BACT|nr:hypothetical protein [Chitinophaga flava]RBL93356.1 hypothetical protein DF182_12610 [Chitinophaga flava]
MMLNKFSKVLVGTGLVLAMAGCSSKNNDGSNPDKPTTVEEDKTMIKATSKNLVDCVKNIKDGQFVRSLFKTAGLNKGNITNEAWLDDLTDALDVAFNHFELDPNNSRFNYANYVGNYTWNPGTKKFVVTKADNITVSFPSDPTTAVNDYVFAITEYKDAKFQANALDIYLPTSIKGSLKKGTEELMTINYSGEFGTGNFPIPSKVVLNLTLKPHNFLVKVEKLSNTQFNVTTELQSASDCVTALNAKVTFKDDDYNNLKIEEDLVSVIGSVKKGDLTLKGSLDAKAYFQLPSNAKADQYNTVFNVSAYSKEQEVAQLKLKDANGSQDLIVFYKDKSSEAASVYTDSFIKDLKAMLQPDFGADVENWFERTAQSNGAFSKKIVNLKNKLSGWINRK